MRVITGIAKGRRLKTLEGLDVRPTTDMVKEAIFSVIRFDLEGANILDLFCGSGQLGVEALSGGAKSCRFVDSSRSSLDCARENAAHCGLDKLSSFTLSDSVDFIRNARINFDILFLDPPYNKGLIEKVMPFAADKISFKGIAVCEHERGLELPEEYGKMKRSKTYRYGKTEVTVYRVPIDEEGEVII
ncbi:MAG: 16S rRNA (guanine(966)-N(2))-methyltransferase RsmD [Ruminococcus sp.]|nr:16S rRNA (guanine(966)-N(2))-methyltransferase RsmD [Ruminococcus sp.]